MRDWDKDIITELRCIIYLLGKDGCIFRMDYIFRVDGDRKSIICSTIDKLRSLDINSATIKDIFNEYNIPLDYIEDDGSTEVDQEVVEFFSEETVEKWLDENADKIVKNR